MTPGELREPAPGEGASAPKPDALSAGGESTGWYDARPEDEISLLELVNVLLRRWRLVVGLPIGAAIVTGAVSLMLRPMYTATTAFVPEASSGTRLPSGLAGLAGQFGLSLGAEASQSPDFYAKVLKSREIMDRVLLTKFPDPGSGRNPPDSLPLLQLLRVKGDSTADSLHRGRKVLARRISVSVDRTTGIVRLDVEAPSPVLAAAVANSFLRYLNEFNAQTRQSRARERRKFVEGRITDAEGQLRQAEEDLRAFYERNRSWQHAPQLVVEEDRLRRQVQIRQEVYLTLKREYETARIEEVNDTPVITVVDSAVVPQEKSKPKRALLTILAFVLGGMLGIFAAFGAAYTDRVRREDESAYREFRGLVARVRGDLRAGSRTRRPGPES